MGYKRCLPVNEFENSSISKAKRFQCQTELVSLADVDTPNSTLVKPVILGKEEVGFYNIRWYDAPETDIATEIPQDGDKSVKTIGCVVSNSSEDETGSGMTSLSSVSSDCLDFDITQGAFESSDDVYSGCDHSPRKPVSVGPNYQATIPDWKGRVNKALEFTGTYNDNSHSSGIVSLYSVDENETMLMGISVLAMPDMGFYLSKYKEFREGRTNCNCLDQGSIRCIRQHVRESRNIMRETLGNESFVKLGFCDMGEEVALKWSEEEEEIFHEVVYSNPASLGRNFWKHLSAAFPYRTKKEIVSYYFNVFMLRKRAAQNRSRFLDIDSDGDECETSNADDDSAIESLGEPDVCVETQDNYSDDNDDDDHDSEDDTSDYGSQHKNLGSDGYYLEKDTTEEERGIKQRSLNCKVDPQIENWGTPLQHVDGTSGIPKGDFVGQDDSCMSFECQTNVDGPPLIHKEEFGVQEDSCLSFEFQTNMDVSCLPCGLVDGNSALHAGGIPSNLDFPGQMMEHTYLLEPSDTQDCYPGYSAADIGLLSTSNLIEEFFGHRTPDRKTRND